MLQLYHSPASPFCRMIDVLLHETGQFADVEPVRARTNALEAGTSPVAANPLGKIPALTRDDGPAIFDSRVICRYLDARAGGRLYPETRLWEVLTLEALAHGIAEAALLLVMEARFREEAMRSEAWMAGQWAKITRGLDAVEAQWMSHLRGPLTMGQVAVGCALGYVDFRLGARPWREGRGALAEWEAEFAGRASMQATVPHD